MNTPVSILPFLLVPEWLRRPVCAAVLLSAAALSALGGAVPDGTHDEAGAHSHRASVGLANTLRPAKPADRLPMRLPPVPRGVVELKFSELFSMPVGPRGLEWTEKARQADGCRVRMLGYMVRQEHPQPGVFLFSPLPAQVHEHDNGLADDLPPTTVLVSSPSHKDQIVPHTPQLMLLTGTLELGNRAEPNGRMSAARLTIDPVPKIHSLLNPPSRGKGAERLMSRRASTDK